LRRKLVKGGKVERSECLKQEVQKVDFAAFYLHTVLLFTLLLFPQVFLE
jgi:hypothetical protein